MSQLVWQKSSYSTGRNHECVEVAADAAGTIHLRESDAPTTVATTTPPALRALLTAIKAERVHG
jgi:hypothetical protein